MTAICSTCRNPFNDEVVSIRSGHTPYEALTTIFVSPSLKQTSTRMQTRSSSRKEFEEKLFENDVKMCPNCDEMLAILYDKYKGFIDLIHPESDVGKKLGHLVSEEKEKKADLPPPPPTRPISPPCFMEKSSLPPQIPPRRISVVSRNGRPRKIQKATISDDKSSSFTTFRDPTATRSEKQPPKRHISPQRSESPTHESPYVTLPDSPLPAASQEKRRRNVSLDEFDDLDESDMSHDPYFNIPDCCVIPNQAILLPKPNWAEEKFIYDCESVNVTKPKIPIDEGLDESNVWKSDDEEMAPVVNTRELFATEWYRNEYFIKKMNAPNNPTPARMKNKYLKLMNLVVVEEIDEGCSVKGSRNDDSPVPSLCSDSFSESVCDGDDEDSDCDSDNDVIQPKRINVTF